MFDTLTRDDLYALHSRLFNEGLHLHQRFLKYPPLSEEASVLMAKGAEVSETMRAVYAEIDRRNTEADADA